MVIELRKLVFNGAICRNQSGIKDKKRKQEEDMRKRIAAGLLAFALAFTAMDFGGLVSIQANAAGLVQVTEENQSNFHLNGDYAGYYAIADKEDLQAFAAKVNAGEKDINAVLTADIDMTGEDWTTDRGYR